MVEDAWRQYVATYHAQLRGRLVGFRLLHDAAHTMRRFRTRLDANDAIALGLVTPDVLDCDDRASTAGVDRSHLCQHRRLRVDQIVGENHGKRFQTHDGQRAQYRVSEAERLRLPNVYARDV